MCETKGFDFQKLTNQLNDNQLPSSACKDDDTFVDYEGKQLIET